MPLLEWPTFASAISRQGRRESTSARTAVMIARSVFISKLAPKNVRQESGSILHSHPLAQHPRLRLSRLIIGGKQREKTSSGVSLRFMLRTRVENRRAATKAQASLGKAEERGSFPEDVAAKPECNSRYLFPDQRQSETVFTLASGEGGNGEDSSDTIPRARGEIHGEGVGERLSLMGRDRCFPISRIMHVRNG